MFAEESKKLRDNRKSGDAPDATGGSFSQESDGTTFVFGLDNEGGTDMPGGDGTKNQQTSNELIEALANADSSVLNDGDKIKAFIAQLKGGEVPTKKASDFRKKRLTFEHKDAPPLAGHKIPDASQKAKLNVSESVRNIKSTIFAANEIGARQDKRAPFPSTTMGTFSCHGMLNFTEFIVI